MTREAVFAYVRKMHSKPIKTFGGQTTFIVEEAGNDLNIITADGSEIRIRESEIESALENYNSSSALMTTDSVKIFPCDSYLSALFRNAGQ